MGEVVLKARLMLKLIAINEQYAKGSNILKKSLS